MEEFSQAVLEERDSINEKLLLKEAEIEQERVLRTELNDRLHELQNKVYIRKFEVKRLDFLLFPSIIHYRSILKKRIEWYYLTKKPNIHKPHFDIPIPQCSPILSPSYSTLTHPLLLLTN
jgi:hypothetical protein